MTDAPMPGDAESPMTLERLTQLMENSWPENYTDDFNNLIQRLDSGLKAQKEAADRLLKRLTTSA